MEHRTGAGSVSVFLPTAEVLLREPIQDAQNGKRVQFQQIMGTNRRKVFLFPKHELLALIVPGEDRLFLRKLALQNALIRLDLPIVVWPSDVFATRARTFTTSSAFSPRSAV